MPSIQTKHLLRINRIMTSDGIDTMIFKKIGKSSVDHVLHDLKYYEDQVCNEVFLWKKDSVLDMVEHLCLNTWTPRGVLPIVNTFRSLFLEMVAIFYPEEVKERVATLMLDYPEPKPGFHIRIEDRSHINLKVLRSLLTDYYKRRLGEMGLKDASYYHTQYDFIRLAYGNPRTMENYDEYNSACYTRDLKSHQEFMPHLARLMGWDETMIKIHWYYINSRVFRIVIRDFWQGNVPPKSFWNKDPFKDPKNAGIRRMLEILIEAADPTDKPSMCHVLYKVCPSEYTLEFIKEVYPHFVVPTEKRGALTLADPGSNKKGALSVAQEHLGGLSIVEDD